MISNMMLFLIVFLPGLAILCLILLYRAIEVLSFSIGINLGKKKAYSDELMRMKAQLDFAKANVPGGAVDNPSGPAA